MRRSSRRSRRRSSGWKRARTASAATVAKRSLLREFYRDKLSMRQRHFAGAQSVSDYDFNNTYQYVIAREDVQLNWLRDAITGMGSEIEDLPEQYDPGVAGVTAQLTNQKSNAQSQGRALE